MKEVLKSFFVGLLAVLIISVIAVIAIYAMEVLGVLMLIAPVLIFIYWVGDDLRKDLKRRGRM